MLYPQSKTQYYMYQQPMSDREEAPRVKRQCYKQWMLFKLSLCISYGNNTAAQIRVQQHFTPKISYLYGNEVRPQVNTSPKNLATCCFYNRMESDIYPFTLSVQAKYVEYPKNILSPLTRLLFPGSLYFIICVRSDHSMSQTVYTYSQVLTH